MQGPEFEVQIRGTHAIEIPDKYVLPFVEKGHKRVLVIARLDSRELKFHAALQKYQGKYVITFGKRNQKELGVYQNDVFSFQFYEDTSKYGVDMPEELQAVLDIDAEACKIFESLSEGKIRSIIYMVRPYKNSQTRIDKALLIAENLKRGVRKPQDLLKAV